MFKTVNSKGFRDFMADVSAIDGKKSTEDSVFEFYHSEKCKKYRNKDSTIEDFYKYINRRLTKKRIEIIKAKEKELEIRLKYKSGMNRPAVEEFLGIDTKAYKALVDKKILIPYQHKHVRKYGKEIVVPLYCYDDVSSIDPIDVVNVMYSISNTKNKETIIDDVKSLEDDMKKYNVFIYNKKWYTTMPFFEGLKASVRITLCAQPYFSNAFKGDPKNELIKSLEKAKESKDILLAKKSIINILYEPDIVLNKEILNKIQSKLDNMESKKITSSIIQRCARDAFNECQLKLTNDEKNILKHKVNSILSVNKIINFYKGEREFKRHFHIIEGGTNSGKTYQALNSLRESKSGVYLAPLRLLAMEVRDDFIERGIKCNLLTGEESNMVEGASHTASTIEMLNINTEYEAVVIDESHMLEDDDRGGAWTRAIMGAKAKDIYIIGSPSATQSLINLIERMGDSYSVTTKTRRSQLHVIKKHVKYSELEKGDALIAFSRRDIIRYKTILENKGYRVATIYGSMPPTLRIQESKKFQDGEADIVVATDAIGMGLNLPIKRIIFGAFKKYDGCEYRELSSEECKQIAGRAGRDKEDGFVGIIKEKHTQNISYSEIERKLSYMPHNERHIVWINLDFDIVKSLSKNLKTDNLSIIQKAFSMIEKDDGIYPSTRFKDDKKYACIDRYVYNKELKHRLSMINFPQYLDEDFERLLTIKSTSLEKEIEKASEYMDTKDMEQYYQFLLLYRSLNMISSSRWKADKKSLESAMDSMINNISWDMQLEKEYEFSRNILRNN